MGEARWDGHPAIWTKVDGHDAVGGTAVGFGTVAYSKNFLAYTDDSGTGFLRVKLGSTSPISYVTGQTFVPKSTATFTHLSGAGGTANYIPDLAHDDGRIIFSSEDSAGGFGVYYACPKRAWYPGHSCCPLQ